MDVVRGGEVEERRRGHDGARHAIDPCRGLVGQEHDAGLRAELDHVPRAVVFLVAPRALVLLDDVLLVLVDREASGTPVCSCAPSSAGRDTAPALLDGQRRRPAQLLEILAPALIDGGRVRIVSGGRSISGA
jgi:hypothetical protein